MVQFKEVSKIFDNGIAALKDISFAIDEGEFVFLIGPSGSGKTTLIEMLIRDQLPTAGKIYLQDTDITRLNRRKVYMLRRQIGVIFQDYKLVPDKTALENVSFAMEAAGRSNKDIKETVPYLLEIVGLENRMKAFPHQLSGGEKQRVAIARAIANNPRILIADEPTGNLDPASAWDIVQILSKINNWGTTVIMSTHGTDIVNSLNKRVIQMEKGEVVRDDSKGGYELPGESTVPEPMQSHTADDSKKTLQINITDKLKEDSTDKPARKGLFRNLFRKKHPSETDKPSSLPRSLLHKFTSSKDTQIDIKTELTENPEDYGIEPNNTSQFENSLMQKIDAFGSKSSSQPVEVTAKSKKKSSKSKKQNITKNKKNVVPTNEETSGSLPTKEATVELPVEDNSIDELELDPIVRSILLASGYQTIDELIQAGPDGLQKLPKIDPEDVVQIAESIEKYLDKTNPKE